MLDLLRQLQILHNLGFVHCDIKASNIVTTECRFTSLIDFDTLIHLSDGERETQDLGTNGFQAPEIQQETQRMRFGYGTKVDIWSLGVLLYQLITGLHEVQIHDPRVLVEFAETHSGPEGDFLQRALHPDEADRPSASELLGHPYVCDFNQGTGDILADGCGQEDAADDWGYVLYRGLTRKKSTRL